MDGAFGGGGGGYVCAINIGCARVGFVVVLLWSSMCVRCEELDENGLLVP